AAGGEHPHPASRLGEAAEDVPFHAAVHHHHGAIPLVAPKKVATNTIKTYINITMFSSPLTH
ncbi:MAG: hypothetical protein PUH85_01255, partial [Firmicutes bacterium]|nr:hypothetical protein [Bacillota bacterium]